MGPVTPPERKRRFTSWSQTDYLDLQVSKSQSHESPLEPIDAVIPASP